MFDPPNSGIRRPHVTSKRRKSLAETLHPSTPTPVDVSNWHSYFTLQQCFYWYRYELGSYNLSQSVTVAVRSPKSQLYIHPSNSHVRSSDIEAGAHCPGAGSRSVQCDPHRQQVAALVSAWLCTAHFVHCLTAREVLAAYWDGLQLNCC